MKGEISASPQSSTKIFQYFTSQDKLPAKIHCKYPVPKDVAIIITLPGQSGVQFRLKNISTHQDKKPFSLLPNDSLTLLNAELHDI
jgi:hypothetical protein